MQRAPRTPPLSAAPTAHRPWWLRAMPWVQHAPALTRHQWRLLGVVGAANLFENYGYGILGLALPQIQAGLQVAEDEVGALTAAVRMGVVPAILFSTLADHLGRRRLLLVTIIGYAVTTFFTAFAADARQFIAMQFLSRAFIGGEVILSAVVIAEEFDAATRGWGLGMLGALGTLGHGLAALVFGIVNHLPFGWRALYIIGVVPLLLVAWFRRTLGETRRFELHRELHAAGAGLRDLLQPFRNLLHMYPGRMIALCAALVPMSFMIDTSMLFVSKTLQGVHGYSPGAVGLLYLTVGVVAPIGNVIAGSLGDRFGRKRVMIVGLLANATGTAVFYNSTGVWVPLAWALMLVTVTTILVLVAALGTELFPTSYRSTASGVRFVVGTVGAALGLWLEGVLYSMAGSHAAAITWMLVITPIPPLIVAFCLPETANQELEEISPEKE